MLRRPVVNGSGARAVARGELASGPPEAARFLGGGGLFDRVTAMAVDGGDLYVVGETESADFPVTPGAVQPELEGPRDLFVARLDASSLAVEAATFLGGEADERSGGIALGPEDVVYVAGTTTSIDFPAPRPDGGGADAFLVGLTRDLGAVVYAVAPGGVRDDEALALAAGPRYVWLAGATRSAEWGAAPPARPGAPERGDLAAFVLRLDPGAGLADAPRRFGGTENDRATAVAISPRGVVVAGTTFSRDLAGWEDAPLTPRHPHQPPGADAFIIAVPQDPGPPFFAVRLGGGATDTAAAVTVDSTGLIHVAGRTSSPDFPTTRDAYDRVLGGQADAFVATLSPAGDLIASTFIGGTSHDEALAVATSGQAVIAAGLTTSSDFPADAAPAFGPGGRTDAFIVGMDAVGLTLARRYGGSGYDDGAALATLGPAAVAVGGATGSHDLATTPGLGDAFPGGLESGWVGVVGVAGGSPRPPQRPTAVLVPGWGGLGDIQTSCAPSLVHHDQGAVSSPGMSVIGDWLVDDGFDVWHAVLDTGPGHTASLEDGAACLARQLADLRRSHPALGPVALVGYSLGGLVARAYVEDDVLFARDVSTLVTLGAPHGGIPADGLLALGAFLGLGERVDCATQAGLCEVTSSAIPRFEARHPSRRPGVRYAAVSGAIASPDASWLGRALGAWLPGADDGLVKTASGLGLRGPVATGRPPEAHVAQLLGAPLAGRTYFTPAPGRGTSGAYENCLLPILRGAAGCGPGTAAEPDAGAGDRTPVTVATVAAGDSVTMSLPLAPGVGAIVTAAWDRGPMQLEVIGPG
ncbi:MAG: esterase/lipase family protein, partial [Anaerolineae bacterium]